MVLVVGTNDPFEVFFSSGPQNPDGTSDVIRGKGGFDTFSFWNLNEMDKAYGGAGDDLLEIDYTLSEVTNALLDAGLFFHGGKGYDQLHLTVDVDLSGAARLEHLTGVTKSVEETIASLIIMPGLTDLRVIGTSDRDVVSLSVFTGAEIPNKAVIKLKGGNDEFHLSNLYEAPGLKVFGGGGKDKIVNQGYADGAKIKGNAGADVIKTADGVREIVNGGKGRDVIFLSELENFNNVPGSGTDKIKGGGGADRFVFRDTVTLNGDHGKIVDFDPEKDKLVAMVRYSPFEDVHGYSYESASGEFKKFDNVLLTLPAGTVLTDENFVIDTTILAVL